MILLSFRLLLYKIFIFIYEIKELIIPYTFFIAQQRACILTGVDTFEFEDKFGERVRASAVRSVLVSAARRVLSGSVFIFELASMQPLTSGTLHRRREPERSDPCHVQTEGIHCELDDMLTRAFMHAAVPDRHHHVR